MKKVIACGNDNIVIKTKICKECGRTIVVVTKLNSNGKLQEKKTVSCCECKI